MPLDFENRFLFANLNAAASQWRMYSPEIEPLCRADSGETVAGPASDNAYHGRFR
jgi:hypothetical protein